MSARIGSSSLAKAPEQTALTPYGGVEQKRGHFNHSPTSLPS